MPGSPRHLINSSWTVICVVVVSTLSAPTSTNAAPQKTIQIVECEINGFGLGDSADQMYKTFGKPDPDFLVKTRLNEYPHHEYQFDGLRIVFSTHGRSAMSYYVSSPAYRLRSGVGVGSMWREVIETLGPGLFGSSGGVVLYSYRIVDSEGKFVPATLEFVVENDVVKRFSVVTRN